MTQEELIKGIRSLLDEYHKTNSTTTTEITATNIVNNWTNDNNRNENIDEIHSDYVDDEGATVIDIWLHGQEEGFSVARVLPHKTVEWICESYKNCSKVIDEIETVKSLLL